MEQADAIGVDRHSAARQDHFRGDEVIALVDLIDCWRTQLKGEARHHVDVCCPFLNHSMHQSQELIGDRPRVD